MEASGEAGGEGAGRATGTTLGKEEASAKHKAFLEGFKPQMDRLHRAFLGSLKREKALVQKCRMLKDRLAAYAQGLEVAKRMKELDDRTIAGESKRCMCIAQLRSSFLSFQPHTI